MKWILSLLVVFMGACSTAKKPQNESERFNTYLDKMFDEALQMSPEDMTAMGLKQRYSELDDYSLEFQEKMKAWKEARLKEFDGFRVAELDESTKTSYDLAKRSLEEDIANYKWRDYRYVYNQQYGMHTNLPVFMMNMHQVKSESELNDYISRLNAFSRVFKQANERVHRSEKLKVIPPRFVFPYVIEAAQNIVKGAPFDKSKKDSPLLADFKKKLAALKLGPEKEKEFTDKAIKALLESVAPAYKETLALLKDQQKRAPTVDGVWRFEKGGEFYQARLDRVTTTSMTPEQIHAMGLMNVERIHKEMQTIMKKLNYKGDLQSFFKMLREDKKFYYPNSEEGRKAYLTAANDYYQKIHKRIPEFFSKTPKAPFEIRAVEKFRENSAGVAFYETPAEDGSRPGIYYVNLKEMRDLPKFENEVVLYHEGAPGHHFQLALAQEMVSLPKFRRYMDYTAFVEGWGLYTESLAKEMGAYQDLYSQFGQMSLELLRAARLVVDTGIHNKKWSRSKALAYFNKNLPGSLADHKNEIERYIVMPGQATAYMVGKLKIEQLRERAKTELGAKFDIRAFHQVVLGSGALPLDVLESQVQKYIDKTGGKKLAHN